ncbi:bis(5'-adenosyl)-triphosphatase, partial [Tremellales sp. Uapishka_1]
MARYLFSTFDVTRQVFYTSPLSLAIVNLKPLLPGHILVIPHRVVPRLADLTPSEISDLFLAVQRVGSTIEKVYEASGLTVSLQDGAVAGQSVPHVHVHIMPRKPTDYGGENDRIYPLIEASEAGLRNEHLQLRIPKDEERVERDMEVMEREAQWLAGFFRGGE